MIREKVGGRLQVDKMGKGGKNNVWIKKIPLEKEINLQTEFKYTEKALTNQVKT